MTAGLVDRNHHRPTGHRPIEDRAPLGRDYAATKGLVRDLPPSDARRVLPRRRGCYVGPRPATIASAGWLSEEMAP
jgi:hypothetical protein